LKNKTKQNKTKQNKTKEETLLCKSVLVWLVVGLNFDFSFNIIC